jgi:hypothetical protein
MQSCGCFTCLFLLAATWRQLKWPISSQV